MSTATWDEVQPYALRNYLHKADDFEHLQILPTLEQALDNMF